MSDSDQILRRLIAIENRTDSMEDSLAWLVHSEEGLLEKMVDAFGSSRCRVQVYLALDGEKNGKTLAAELGMKAQNVSREIGWLKKKRLIDIAEANGDGIIYKHKFFDSIIGLSDALAKKFGIVSKRGRRRK